MPSLKESLKAFEKIAGKVASTFIGGAMNEKKLRDMLNSRTGGTEVFDTIKNDALKSGQGVNQALQNSLSFLSVTKNPDRLSKLNNFSERLNVTGAGGSSPEGATEALKALMTDGNTSALVQEFNIPKTLIAQSGIGDMGEINTGNIDEFISRFDQLMESANMGQAQFDRMLDDPAVKWQGILSNLKSQFADAGSGALQVLSPALNNLFEALKSGKFQPFFDSLSTGLAIAAIGVADIVDGLVWLSDVFQQNWAIIEPILVTITSALLPYMIEQLWNMIVPILYQAAAWLRANWPILLIGAAIGFVLYAMIRWGETTVEVIGFIGGLLGVFLAFLINVFSTIDNLMSSVGEFILNVFVDPVYAVKKLFLDLAISVLQFLTNIAKGIENIINIIPGLHVDITSNMGNWLNDLEAARDNLKSDKDVVHTEKKDQIDYGAAFNTGQDIGKKFGNSMVNSVQGMFNSIGDLMNGPNKGINDKLNSKNQDGLDSNVNSVGSVGSVGEIGKINNKVDISSEDLKTLRELAEMKNVQNFVTLTPTVAVQTGDIRHGEDANTLVDKIKTMLVTELASSAAGVYS